MCSKRLIFIGIGKLFGVYCIAQDAVRSTADCLRVSAMQQSLFKWQLDAKCNISMHMYIYIYTYMYIGAYVYADHK